MDEKTITSYFQEDHIRLDRLFDQFQTLKVCDYPEAKKYFKEFKSGLQRHIIWEEEILFPIFESKTGMKLTGPTAVMRLEHHQIKEALENVHQKVREENPDSDAEETALLTVLSLHNQKEEDILYPVIDRLTSGEERKKVFREIEKIPQERYQSCCGDTPTSLNL